MNWYKIAQQLELFQYGDEAWPLSLDDQYRRDRAEERKRMQREYEELQQLRRQRGSYYEPDYFEELTKTLINSALRSTIKDFGKTPIGHEVIGSWFIKNSKGIQPKDFDILITVDDVSDIVGKRGLVSEMEFSWVSIDIFYTDGRRSVAPVQISPQEVEYQIKKIRGV